MRSTFKVLFYLKKGRETASGEVMIMARITVNGEQCQFSTKQKIAPNLWSVEASRAIGRTKEIQNINILLDEIKANLIKIYHEMQLTDNYVTVEKVRNTFMGGSQNCTTILELFKKHNEDVLSLVGISKSKSTFQKYEVTRKPLSEFIRFKYNMSDVYVNEINPSSSIKFRVDIICQQ